MSISSSSPSRRLLGLAAFVVLSVLLLGVFRRKAPGSLSASAFPSVLHRSPNSERIPRHHLWEFLGGVMGWTIFFWGSFGLIYCLYRGRLPGVSTAGHIHLTKIYESQTLVAATTSIVLTGIAISIPIIMLMWSQLTDSIYQLYDSARTLPPPENGELLHELLAETRDVNKLAVEILPRLLRAVAALLMFLLTGLGLFALCYRSLPRSVDLYYLLVAHAGVWALLAALCFLSFIYCVLRVQAIRGKVEVQERVMRREVAAR